MPATTELIRITISRRTGEELTREVHEVPATPSRPWLDAVADILYNRAVRDGALPDPARQAATGQDDRAG